MIILAIVGSTLFSSDDPEATAAAVRLINKTLDRLRPDRVVSGGAKGIDTLAAAMAVSRGIALTELLPRHQRWAPSGFKERNTLIAESCTHLVCIRHRDSSTYGSGWTADLAEKLGRSVERHII